jgi:toxin-antitoxin system PIN domain toxin
MILVDANLLLYAYDSAAPEHPKARDWLEGVLAKPEPVLFPWQSIHAFLRIATNPRAWKAPLTIEEARAIVEEWLSLPNVVTPSPGERHWDILRELVADSQCRGPLVADAVLAALATEHGAELCTNDRDFSRFPNLRVVNPLQ